PEFAGAGAPDTAVDLTLLGAFAAQVGTRLIGSTAERTAYAYAREGLAWWDTDDAALYVHNGSGWELVFQDWRTYTPVLSNATGTVAASYQVIGETVHVMFALTVATVTGLPVFSLPVDASDSNLDFPNASVML